MEMGTPLYLTTFLFYLTLIILKPHVEAQSEVDYRLPDIYSPSHYSVDLKLNKGIFSGNVTTFEGKVGIDFTVLENTSSIAIHGPVEIDSLQLTSDDGSVISTNYTSYNNVTEILFISTDPTLTTDKSYVLSVVYTGNLELVSMQGLYRSEYINESGEKMYLATTQFQPTNARKAFPCFDEPRYKARFSINITYPTGLIALGNTPIEATVIVDTEYTKSVFKETPLMSTYLVAFIISDFNCTQGSPIDTDVPHGVCSTKESVDDRQLAVEYGPRIMQALESMTGLKYKDHGFGKMHQVALPDFSAGAMENWGLVTYRESSLLWNNGIGTNGNKERILTVIAHEFAHMWFGNLVTCDWWDFTFLNEGFARYFQYFALTKLTDLDIEQVWEMAKQFVIEQQQAIFLSDSFKSSQSLTSVSASPSEISAKFGSISYNKGASIIRMLENVMGSANFFTGLNSYLKSNANSTTVPNKLWSALEPYIQPNVLPSNVPLVEVMENWINSSGFPLVTVSIRGNNVILSQERFLYNTSDYDDTQYYIPISYSTSNMSQVFSDVSPSTWLIPSQRVILNDVLAHNDWIILNNQQSAYYRVNYDTILWARIMEVLQLNHNKIHVLNRAQIVDDAFNLARAGILDYSQTFQIISYLKQETEYFPWYPAITGFNFLQRMYGEDSEIGSKILAFEAELIEGVMNSVSFTQLNQSNQIYSLKLSMILNRACKLGIQSCIVNVRELFRNFKAGSSIDRNLRSTVYCNGLRYSTDSHNDFTFLWGKFITERITSEKLSIMSALGCTKNSVDLKVFLNETLNSNIRLQDFSSAWSAVYTAGPEGVTAALEFFLENQEAIYAHYSSASSLLTNIAARITKSDHITQLENLASSNATTPLEKAIESALSAAKSNGEWASQRKSQINGYFESITTVTVPSPTTFCTTRPEETTEENSAEVIKSTTVIYIFLVIASVSTFIL